MNVRRRLFLAAGAAFLGARAAAAHSRLAHSHPSPDAAIASGAGEITLRFDELAVLTALRLFAPSGIEVPLSRARDATPAATWRARHPALTPGRHRLEWRALSADGHPIGGTISFSVVE
ncbi:MAG: copper resistance protein CopC [Azospirillum sp.]|nr:copper resistance protein CopC [Azospirillum sp.]